MNPTYDFTGSVALITGAASGMGLAAAKAWAEAGASLALVDLDPAALESIGQELADHGHRALTVACDVSDESQMADAVHRTITDLGRLDFAFNNAGIQIPYAGLADEEFSDVQRLTGVNQFGVWAAMKHELRHMRGQGSGSIVNTSSIGGVMGGPGRAAYHATKHAVIGLTRSAAKEFAPYGIRVNAILPGTIETPMVTDMVRTGALDHDASVAAIPLGRLGRAEEIAAAALWLSSPGASFVTGASLLVDGGQLA
ncbi:SDR family NAD(P)-dependent oxidoreductase [Microbacterium sp. NPDC096154]|uniref:SDR family NAD(P)-dependent oxidoreductase n=1 Tax=Microbacterium sp. NPDC096154 TaxID=3155549 RepID=UPI0033296466